MGPQDPLVHIEAVTLAGGDNNQDRYAYGDGWAFVLDGASSFSETRPPHDGGWYADRLKRALAMYLEDAHADTNTAHVVARAIEAAAAAHDSATQGPCPTSTIALARWNDEDVELYVLGDSFAVALSRIAGTTILTDDRIKPFGDIFRQRSRQRLVTGCGFDQQHRLLLRDLQATQSRHRNNSQGYWIAGDTPAAAFQALHQTLSRDVVDHIILATDGIATLDESTAIFTPQLMNAPLHHTLNSLQNSENLDPSGSAHPRSKRHDDKTIVAIWLMGKHGDKAAK